MFAIETLTNKIHFYLSGFFHVHKHHFSRNGTNLIKFLFTHTSTHTNIIVSMRQVVVFSTNKTLRHDVTEIMLKVVLNTIILTHINI